MADPLVLAFRGRDLLFRREGRRAVVPDAAAFEALGLAPVRENAVGAARAVELPDDCQLPDGWEVGNLRQLYPRLDDATLGLALRAVQIVDWDRGNQFCPRCAGPVERVAGELAKRCPRCSTQAYPRISPAVIVLVEREDRVLLGRNARFPLPMYSTLAGFVEAGETIEETIHREIREEAGVEVRDLRYFGSQPWPFPDSLMIAFNAIYAGGELRPDPTEITDAGWFTVDDMPLVPPRISIARHLIDAWVRRQGRDPDTLRSAG